MGVGQWVVRQAKSLSLHLRTSVYPTYTNHIHCPRLSKWFRYSIPLKGSIAPESIYKLCFIAHIIRTSEVFLPYLQSTGLTW